MTFFTEHGTRPQSIQDMDSVGAALNRENVRLLNTIRVQAAAIESMREELAALKAQPVQEPVAWANDSWLSNPYGGHFRAVKSETFNRPLYAAPVQPAPTELSDAEIERLREKTFSTNNPFCPVDSKSMRKAIRAYEAAIKGGAT